MGLFAELHLTAVTGNCMVVTGKNRSGGVCRAAFDGCNG
jgi:hypothetical protein